ncbi:BTAD domain-containing putative transcriptional regulator [Micromonospora sp. NPDC049903]|uniref:AfsR/SARP family transcriptional regulator n=1 Tax=Micromonospora sp. NPDC049903 TaxID=3364276 RepID=UPI0037AA7993
MDLGLAAAITAAAALVWALRRRRYRPQLPGQQRRGDGDLAPLPAVVTHIRRGLRRRHTADDVDILGTDSPSADLTDDRSISSGGVDRPASAGTVGESIREEDLAGGRGPVVPGRDNAVAAAWPPAGLGLTGPGAPAAVRGFLTAALATTAVHGRGTVVICATTAAALLETSVLPESPRLTVTDGLAAALDLCETQALHRTRLLYQHEVDTVADLPDAGHEEPVPPVLLIADAAARHERARVAALLAQGNRLDIHGVLLGRWPEGDTLVVDTDGTTTADGTSRHATGPADLGRLTVLTPTETVDLVTTLAETHTGQPPSTRSVDLPAAPKPPPGPRADGTAEAVPDDGHACTVAAGSAYSAPEGAEFPSGRQAVAPSGHSYQPDTTQSGGLVAVRTLGTARIVEMDTTIPLRAKALELLVYLVVHDGDATQDAILDDLLPDAPRSKAPHRLHTYVSALRKTLTRTGGPGSYLIHPARRYALARDLMDVDLWRMRDALRVAHRATAPDTRLAALRTAVDAYGGALADGFDYEWIEVHREEIRRQALDAHLALAAATGDPAEAVTVLQAAIRHAPYAEPVYQQAMRAHAALGHLDEVRALRETLIHRLDDIDATPSKDTLDLADQLTTDPATGPGHARPRDAGRHS